MCDKLSQSEIMGMLKSEMLNFVDTITDILESYNLDVADDMVYIRFGIMSNNKEQIMDTVSNNILPFEKHIKEKNEIFFTKKENQKKIFGDLPEDKVSFFSDFWNKTDISTEDKDCIWEYFDTFIALAERFKKYP